MGAEDAARLGDGLRVLDGIVPGGHDEFASRAFEVTAPVGHDAIRADRSCTVFVSAFAVVAHDRVVGDAGCEGQGIDGQHENGSVRGCPRCLGRGLSFMESPRETTAFMKSGPRPSSVVGAWTRPGGEADQPN